MQATKWLLLCIMVVRQACTAPPVCHSSSPCGVPPLHALSWALMGFASALRESEELSSGRTASHNYAVNDSIVRQQSSLWKLQGAMSATPDMMNMQRMRSSLA